MIKKTKQYLFVVLQLFAFAFLSVISLYLIVKKSNSDMILLHAIACFFFAIWLCGIIFPKSFFQFVFKMFQKPMSKSMTMDTMGTNLPDEKTAYATFLKMIKILPCFFLATLILEIVLLIFL